MLTKTRGPPQQTLAPTSTPKTVRNTASNVNVNNPKHRARQHKSGPIDFHSEISDHTRELTTFISIRIPLNKPRKAPHVLFEAWLALCLRRAFLYSATLFQIDAAWPFSGLSKLGSAGRDASLELGWILPGELGTHCRRANNTPPSKLWIESSTVRTL